MGEAELGSEKFRLIKRHIMSLRVKSVWGVQQMLGCGIDCDLNTMAEVIGVCQWFGRRHQRCDKSPVIRILWFANTWFVNWFACFLRNRLWFEYLICPEKWFELIWIEIQDELIWNSNQMQITGLTEFDKLHLSVTNHHHDFSYFHGLTNE